MDYNPYEDFDLRRLQMTELNLARILKAICEKYGLRYYMSGGTMLGAVRHKGFIPWDDDMDFILPRPDYEKFLSVVRGELPENIGFLNYKQDEGYNRYFSRLTDERVTITNTSYTNTRMERAWIDIFPVDGMPAGTLRQKLHFWHMTAYRFLYRASCFDELVNLNRPDRPLYLKVIIKILSVTHFGRGLDTKKLMLKSEKGLAKYPYDKNPYLFCLDGQHMFREVMPQSWIGEGKLYRFEDIEMPGPVEADAYLRRFYGDYMTPPEGAGKEKHSIANIDFGD